MYTKARYPDYRLAIRAAQLLEFIQRPARIQRAENSERQNDLGWNDFPDILWRTPLIDGQSYKKALFQLPGAKSPTTFRYITAYHD